MNYEITLSPDLAVSGDEFVDAWEEIEPNGDRGTPRVAQNAESLSDEELLDGGDVLLLETGTDRGELYDILSRTLHQAGAAGDFTFTPINNPDGSVLLAVSHADNSNG